MRLKYFRSAIIIRGPLRNIPEVHVHDNFIDFSKKYFQKCLTTFEIFEN